MGNKCQTMFGQKRTPAFDIKVIVMRQPHVHFRNIARASNDLGHMGAMRLDPTSVVIITCALKLA